MNTPTKIHSKTPPCDQACAMYQHCKTTGDNCSQYAAWVITENIELNKSRTPKKLLNVTDRAKKRAYNQTRHPQLIARQMKIKHWLGGMSIGQLTELGRVLSVCPEQLAAYRSPVVGLSQKFMERMHSIKVTALLQQQGITQHAAA
ncbi:MAG: hypothetical protein RPR40_10195 [Bermanella sp.]